MSDISGKLFYKAQSPSSYIKAKIVAEYFPQYARILLKSQQDSVRYIDLYSGPGVFDDGSWSTPMFIVDSCLKDAKLREKVHLLFNDLFHSEKLKNNLEQNFSLKDFANPPRFADKSIGEDQKINNFLMKDQSVRNRHPTLLFFDPFGYKGINTAALANFLKGWGNELFLFVNINRIQGAIKNSKFDDLMQDIFPNTIGKIRADRRYLASVPERLNLIMDNLVNEFKYFIPSNLYHCSFKFKDEVSSATSHFIVHFTKHSKGYELVKQVYYDFDNIGASLEKDGTYTYDVKKMGVSGLEFEDPNIRPLSEELERVFKGQTLSARKLFDSHQHTHRYSGSHYVKTLRQMVDNQKVYAKFVDEKAHKVSVLIHEDCILTFE